MKTSSAPRFGSLLIFSFIIIASTAFTVNKDKVSGPKDPVKLAYILTEGKTISYIKTSTNSQEMNVEGQTINTVSISDMAFKVKLAGKVDGNLKIEISIDSMLMKIESMQGSVNSRIKDVEGKSFNMVISPTGIVVDVSEASGIKYSIEGQGNVDLSPAFSKLFPGLPEKAVMAGETWTMTDTIYTKTEVLNTTQIINSVNKFEGLEKIDGVECAKISSAITGSMKTNMQNPEMDVLISGPMQGTVIFYFAVKEGYLVKQESSRTVNGTVEITGAQNMSFPMLSTMKEKVEAKK